jgi:hypothetical protein
MAMTTQEISAILKLDHAKVDEVAAYLFPNKLLFSKEDVLVIRDYYVKYGMETGTDQGPFAEYLKFDRIAQILESRLEMARERQRDCVMRLSSVSKMYSEAEHTLPGMTAKIREFREKLKGA